MGVGGGGGQERATRTHIYIYKLDIKCRKYGVNAKTYITIVIINVY